MKLLSVLLFAALSLIGCGKSSSQSPPPVSPGQPEIKEERIYKIWGKSTQEFYNQFLFRTSGACPDKNVRYRFVSSTGAPQFKEGETAKTTGVDIKILMFPDQTYDAVYIEPASQTRGGKASSPRKTIFSGRWLVNEDRLVFESLGTARGVIHEDGPSFILRTEGELLSQDLKAKEVLMVLVRANYVPIPAYSVCK
ncbi:MAG: hypothetical protein AB7G93_02860 [Bdellovibrionales bacterium]